MCIVLTGQDGVVEQARRQLEDLVPVWAVLDYTNTRTIARELLLAKVSILGPEYLEDQLHGGPSEQQHSPITPSQALRNKHQLLHSISVLAGQFGAKIVDVSDNSVIVELTAKTSRVEAFLSLLKPFGVLESARTGVLNTFGMVTGLLTLPSKV
jgi:acetolactate synthase small subunit